MVNRYHIPVVVTTSDELERGEVEKYVGRMLSNLETSEPIHRAYVESVKMADGDGQRLLDMLDRIDDEDIFTAADAIKSLSEDESDG